MTQKLRNILAQWTFGQDRKEDVALIRKFAWSKTKFMEDDDKYFDDTITRLVKYQDENKLLLLNEKVDTRQVRRARARKNAKEFKFR